MKKKLILFLSLIFASSLLVAQDSTNLPLKKIRLLTSLKEYKKIEDLKFNRQFSNQMFAPNSGITKNPVISNVPKISLESNLGEQKATASAGIQFRTNTISLEIKQTFNEKPKKVEPISLDGLKDESSATIAYQYLFRTIHITNTKINNEFNKIKTEYYIDSLNKNRTRVSICDIISKSKNNTVSYYYVKNNDTLEIDTLISPICCDCKTDTSTLVYIKNPKLTAHDQKAIRELTYARLDALNKQKFKDYLLKNARPNAFFNISANIGKNTIKYITDTSSIYPVKESKVNQQYKITAGAFFYRPHAQIVIAGSYSISDVYEPGSDVFTYMFPIGTNGSYYSDEVTVGQPFHNINTKVSLESRINFIDIPFIENIAISPTISYGIEKNAVALNLPIFFIRNKDDNGKVEGLSGGINIGYATEITTISSFKDGFISSIFIAAPFSLLKGLIN